MATDDELIAAYLDGVGELTPEERKRVEAILPAHRDEVAAVASTIEALRALPAEGSEPDWAALERDIRAAVGPAMPALPWWRRLRWLAPLGALPAAAAIALVVLHHPHAAEQQPVVPADAAAPAVAAHEPEAPTTLWLDGQVVDVEDVDPAVLLDDDSGADPMANGGLLPAADLRWLDSLDDTAIERAEHWLDGKQKG